MKPMTPMRRFAAGIGLAVATMAAHAQLPAKPIRMIVPILAGGPLDAAARTVAQGLQQVLGTSIVVENRPGGDGAVAAQAILAAPADGTTLFFANNTAIIGAPLFNKSLGYDPAADFAPISFAGRMSLVVFVHPDLPVKTLGDFVQHARANPGKLAYATSTIGDVLAAAQLAQAAGVSMVRVPYKGAAQAFPDLIAGRVQMAVAPLSAGLAHARDGRLRMLAIILPQRASLAPELPTIAEAGLPDVTVSTWAALFGPAKLPADVAAQLARAMQETLARPEVRQQLDARGFVPEATSPARLAEIVRAERELWTRIVRENRITAD